MGDRVQSGLSLATAHDCQALASRAALRRRRVWPLLAIVGLAFALGLWRQRHFFHDDAYVSLRYADRLLAGHGLTWNDGERVEGFSSPSWVAQIALLGGLGISLPLAARLLGVVYTLATLVLWYRARAEPAGLLALVTVSGFTLWAWGGLETVAACFWILVAMVMVQRVGSQPTSSRGGLLFGLSLASVALFRPEGMAVGMSLLGAAWPARRGRSFRIGAVCLVAVFVAYEIFRLAYFGDWIANGARAKTLGLPVGTRVESAAIYLAKTAPQWLGAVFVAGWMLAWSPERKRVCWLLLPVVPLLLVVVLGGGDHMLGARFMLAPVAVMCLAGGLAPPSPRRWVRYCTPALAAVCALAQFQIAWRHPAAPNPAAAIGEIVGRALEARLAPGTLVATATAGSVPYFAPSLAFIDTLGLNDRHIARQSPAMVPAALAAAENWAGVPGHLRGDGDYVLSRRPEVVVLGGANGDIGPWFLGDYQVITSKAFQDAYVPWRLLIAIPTSLRPWVADEIDAETGRLPVTLYVRRDTSAWSAIARDAAMLSPLWASARL